MNAPIIFIRGSEFQHLLETHHVFLRQPFVIISCQDVFHHLYNIDDCALAGFLDRGLCQGVLALGLSENKPVHPKILRDVESFNNTIMKLKQRETK
jgi:hypothetical protein